VNHLHVGTGAADAAKGSTQGYGWLGVAIAKQSLENARLGVVSAQGIMRPRSDDINAELQRPNSGTITGRAMLGDKWLRLQERPKVSSANRIRRAGARAAQANADY